MRGGHSNPSLLLIFSQVPSFSVSKKSYCEVAYPEAHQKKQRLRKLLHLDLFIHFGKYLYPYYVPDAVTYDGNTLVKKK